MVAHCRISTTQTYRQIPSYLEGIAEAALLRFKCGEGEAAIRLVKAAMDLFGPFPEPNSIFVDSIRAWRTYVDEARQSN